MLRKAVAFMALSLISVYPCQSETVYPKYLKQEFDFYSDKDVTECTLLPLITSLPDSEVVNFRVIFIGTNDKKKYFLNYIVIVGDEIFVNGSPSSINPAKLNSAIIYSDNFSTNGHFNIVPQPLGGIMGTTINYE